MLSISSIAVVASLLATSGAGYDTQAAAKQSVHVREVLQVLKVGTLAEREAALADVLALDAARKSVEILAAVAGELSRVNAILEAREQAWRNGKPGPAEEGDLRNYYHLLVSVVSGSENPIVIQPLIGAIETGGMARDALARFGSRAFPFVTAIARNHAEAMHIHGALLTLEKMVTTGVLSPREKTEVVLLAAERMEGTQRDVVWSAAMKLALATGDKDLRTTVERIADGTLVVSTSGEEDMSGWVRHSAGLALGRPIK